MQNRGAYWAAAIERLGIQFRKPHGELVDLSAGVESPRWLPGARLNIVESCFAAPADSPAIIHQAEGGALAIFMPMTAEAVAIYLGISKAGCVVVGIADSFRTKEIAARLRLANAVAVFTQDVALRGGKALPLYANAVEAGAPAAIVLPARDCVSVPLRAGDCAWPEFLESGATFEAVPREPSDGGPSRLVIYAVRAEEMPADKDALMAAMQSAIRRELNPLFKIHGVIFVDALPRTTSNKVMRCVLEHFLFR